MNMCHLSAKVRSINVLKLPPDSLEGSNTRNSSGDEIANVNFFYDDIVQVLQNVIRC